MSHALPELVPVLLALVFSMPFALTGTLILVIDMVTEQLPAISFVYEPAEAQLMLLPPRDRKVDHLVDAPLLLYVGVLMPILLSLAACGAFFLAMAQRGYPLSALLYRSDLWAEPSPEAAAALASGVSAYFFTLVLTQAGVHAFLAKTNRTSIFVHGVCGNRVTLAGAAVALGVACLCIFPLQGDFFGTGPMAQATSWVLWLAFALVSLPLTEAAKAAARRWPHTARRWLW